MTLVDDLNPQQRQAVEHVHGPLLILAGAGSGKTRVIVHRIAHLLATGRATPDELLAVTFTNKAAEEMRSRVERLLDQDCRRLWISTFHSLCARLLRREAPAIGLSRDFVIYDSTDQLALMKRVLRELAIDDAFLQPRIALSRISHAKNTMEGRAALEASSFGAQGDRLARVYDRYTAALTESQALDFDDLLLKTVDLFERVEPVRRKYAERFQFVMVDEYQDTNRPQYLLVQRLAEAHHNLCVVGDPDQSIYKWRGADIRNILDFERDFPDPLVVRLEQNYRSTQVILDTASAIISRSRNRHPKKLWTDRTGGAQVLAYRGADELEEAAFITRTITPHVTDRTDTAPAVAVLYRTNAQSRVIEDALTREGVPYRMVGGVRFYERKEIKDGLAYLKLVLNPHDDVAVRRVINVPARGIGRGVLEGLERVPDDLSDRAPLLASDTEPAGPRRSLWSRLDRAVAGRLLPTRATTSLRTFRDLIVNLTRLCADEPVSVAIGKVLDQCGYLTALRHEGTEDAEGRIENLLELVSAAREYETREPEASLAGFVDRLSLLSEVDEESGARHAGVWLMTMHSAKGLEFPAVIVAGMEEGLFPHARASEDEAELDEERRLCYVAMTRARTHLVLTSAARRRVFGEYRASEPSRFLEEVPDELLDHEESPSLSLYQGGLPYSGRRADFNGSRRRRRRADEQVATPAYQYEDEDQSLVEIQLGSQVKHARFGIGTVIGVEPVSDDLKVVVRFATGAKTLRAKYAKLEPL